MYKHHHHIQHNGGSQPAVATTGATSPETAQAADVLEKFIAASTFKSVLHHHRQICELLKLRPANIRQFYPKLRAKLKSWKAQTLWAKFDKRASHKCYNHGKACANTKVLIIGCGPCGLRTAIEAQLLGAQVVVVEKRDRFSRNNVLHLWPFVITDLKALGAKKFYGKFCAGSIDHISIRQLQCILLKVALLLGVRVFEGLGFEELVPPPQDQTEKIGWRARFSQPDHSLHQYEFDVLVGADGKRNTLPGFKRTEFRGKLAIAVTANFINKRSEGESSVQEISGVAFIFNQKFFKELKAATGIDLENIVYYKDETHYFVMTAKKQSLIDKGVIIEDLMDTQQLLHSNNVDREALQDYAREAADFSTNYQMPHLDFAVNHYGHPDVAMFDFTSMFAAENACRAQQVQGHRLLMGLVGDSLLEPFWPTGSGCARGFLSAFDAAWMMKSWAAVGPAGNPLEVLAERESIYRLLAQTTPRNLSKDHTTYTLEPWARYPTINTRAVLPFQVRQLFSTDDPDSVAAFLTSETSAVAPHLHVRHDTKEEDLPRKRKRRDSLVDPDALLNWCQRQVSHLSELAIEDLTTAFQDGLALCGILHRYRPELIPFAELSHQSRALNNQLAFDVLQSEFGVPPMMTGAEMAECEVPERQSMICYLSRVHHALRGELPHVPHEEDACDGVDEPPSLLPPRERGLTCRVLQEDSAFATSTLDKKNKKYRTERPLTEQGGAEPPTVPRGGRGGAVDREDFDDRVKYLEAKFKGEPQRYRTDKKPKDMVRAIGRLEKTDWNLAAIERKIEDNPRPAVSGEAERVPKWNREAYDEKMNTMERRLRANGEKEETIAKYKDVDAYLKRLEKKLREGSTLDVGLKGHNKVSNLASQLSSKLTSAGPAAEKAKQAGPAPTKAPVVVQLPVNSSDICYFCDTRVYLVEKLSAEGKFFHRHCFRCHYCNVLLRLGSYIYDREGRYGGRFFCIPHFGLTGPRKAAAAAGRVGEASRGSASATTVSQQPGGSRAVGVSTKVSDAVRADMEERGTTPERVEFENSLVEQGSDEEDYLSEEEWTDRNFGASANELDDTNSSDEFCDSEGGSESGNEEEGKERPQHPTPHLPKSHKKATSARWREGRWQRGYRSTRAEEHESESDLESDEYSGEYGAEGDESHTATEGEGGADDDDEEDGEELRRQRERRKLEIRHTAPPKHTDTSDTASDTEIASDGSAESDTQIDTDSEFGEDEQKNRGRPHDIPSIIIGEEDGVDPAPETIAPSAVGTRKPPLKITERILVNESNGAEKSASLTSLSDLTSSTVVPSASPVQQLRARLGLHRTESNEALTSERNLLLRRKYLLGQGSSLPKKSVSTADLGNKFKSFMEKISETQKMLHPAPEPSPAMQAFINSSTVKGSPQGLSPLSPSSLLPGDRGVMKIQKLADVSKSSEQSSASQVQKDKDDLDRNLKTGKTKNDSELDFGEMAALENPPRPHVSATNDSLFVREEENNDLNTIFVNTEDVVETVNESLVQRDFQTMAAELGVDNSLHSVKSVPSDVDDLFDQLARDAQDEPASFLSLTAALEGDNSTNLLREKPAGILAEIEPTRKLGKETYILRPGELREETNARSLESAEREDNLLSVVEKKSPLEGTYVEPCSPVEENLKLSSEDDSPVLEGLEVKFGIRCATAATTSNSNALCFPRVASMESLGETDSTASAVLRSVSEALPALPVVPPPVVEEEEIEVPAVCMNVKSNMLSEIDALDFMDVNGEEVSETESSKRTSHSLPNKAHGPVAVASEGVEICQDSPSKTVSSSPSRDVANTNISYERICNLTIDSDSSVHVEVDVSLRNESRASQSKMDNSNGSSSTKFDENVKEEADISSFVVFPETGSCGSPQETSTPADLAADVISVDMDEEYERNNSKDGFGSHVKESALGSSPVHSKSFESGCLNKQSRSSSPPSEEAPAYSSTSSSSNDAEKSSSLEKKPSSSKSPLGLSLKLNSCSKEASLSSPDLVKNITFKTDISSSSNTNLTSPDRVKLTVFSGNPSEQKKLPSSSSSTSTTPTKRYEGYIPRFKDHISPFSFARDTLDIRKDNRISSSSFGVDKATEAERLKSKENTASQATSPDKPAVTESTTATAVASPAAENGLALQKRDKNAFNAKKKDGDVVQQLVLSRISRKTPEKTNRRNSRPTFSPLNSKEDLLEESKSSLPTTSSVINSKSSSNVPSIVAATNGVDSPRELNKSVGNLSGSVLLESSQRYTPKMSQYSPIETRLSGRNRANTVVGAFSRDNKAMSLSNLPATPLTHPHQFENLSSFTPSPLRFDPTSDDPQANSRETDDDAPRPTGVITTPVSAVISGLDLERSEAREKARDLAKAKSDFDLGLSPPHVSVSVMSRLKRKQNAELVNTPECTTGAHNLRSSQRRNSGKSLTSQDGTDELAVLSDRAKEERVRKLLAEQRARDAEAKHKREVRDDKVMEKLKEFRVKKDKQSLSLPDAEASSAPHHENGDKFERRSSRRPSILELESMQVFVRPQIAVATVVNIDDHRPEESKFVGSEISAPSSLSSSPSAPLQSHTEPHTSIPVPFTSGAPFFISSAPAVVTPPLSTSTPVTSPSMTTHAVPSVAPSSPPPLTPSQISASKAAASQYVKPSSERKSKSKDRERRRSLIQVFAGMFKSSSSGSPDERRPSGGSSPSPSSSTSPPSLTVPKSPATAVRDKLARLRLPKSKESKSGKKRSSSSEVLDDSSGDPHPQSPDSRLAFSLPTSPAHHTPTPPSATTSSGSSGPRIGHQHPSFALTTPPHASEESLTDDESSGPRPTAPIRSPPFVQPTVLSREAELKRLRQAQEIERQLKECETRTRELERRGAVVERSLRGEPGGEAGDESELMSEWFELVHEKTGLSRWEQELSIRARQLELEDRDARLQHQLSLPGGGAGVAEELRSVREQREHLRVMLEQDRLRYVEEDRDIETVMIRKGLQLPSVRRETGV